MSEQQFLSVEELIKGKVKYQQGDDKEITSTLSIPRLKSKIKLTFTKNDVRDFLEVTQNPQKRCTVDEAAEAGENLIYSVVSNPNLKDKALQDAYECKVPSDIVHAIFNDGEMSDIVNHVIKKAGFLPGTIVEVTEVKN